MAFQWTMKSVAFLWDLWSHSHRMTPRRLQHTFGWKLMWQIFMYVSVFSTVDSFFQLSLCHDDCLFFQLLMDGATSVLEVVKIATVVSANIPTQVSLVCFQCKFVPLLIQCFLKRNSCRFQLDHSCKLLHCLETLHLRTYKNYRSVYNFYLTRSQCEQK